MTLQKIPLATSPRGRGRCAREATTEPSTATETEGPELRGRSRRELVRLQCYEGLDESKALYEWNYRKQLLRIQAGAALDAAGDPVAPEAGDATGDVLEDIFSEEFLLTRPLMTAISSPDPVVL